MIGLPLVMPGPRTVAEREARAAALRVAFGPPDGWPEVAREELEERVAIVATDGIADAERVAEDAVRASLLRSVA